MKLGSLVVLPMVLGQLLRLTPVVNLAERFYSTSRTLSSLLLLAIVYTTFADTFISGLGVGGLGHILLILLYTIYDFIIVFNTCLKTDLIVLMATIVTAYVGFSAFFWSLSKKIVPGLDARARTAALLASSQKTLGRKIQNYNIKFNPIT